MKKVVAFLEKYAEWLALTVGCVFLLYMVYSYVVSPDAIKVTVGGKPMLPGEVDPHINTNSVIRLQTAMDAGAGDMAKLFEVPDFASQFTLAMGPARERMSVDIFAGGLPFRPFMPPEFNPSPLQSPDKNPIPLVEMFALTPKASSMGNSLVEPPADLVRPGADAPPPPVAPPPGADPLANALDKNWVTVEYRLDTKKLAEAWKKAFFDPKTNTPFANVPQQVMLTSILLCEVEREEQTAPGVWGNKVTLQPLPLVWMEPYPKPGNRQDEEAYRLWAEKHQVDLGEPLFYRVLFGDPWYIPSAGAPRADNGAADVVAVAQPFDPANPPANRPLTADEKQQVYLYKQKADKEKQKADAAARKAKADAAEAARKSKSGAGGSGSGASGGGGRRSIGGYAPLPIELAAGPGLTDDAGRPIAPRGGGRVITPNRTDAGRTAIPPRDLGPVIDPTTGRVQNAALSGPFDPTKMVDLKGNADDIILWAHDDTAVPGKTYRYKMRVYLKNPLYNTFGVAKNQADAAQFALISPWSDWMPVSVPPTTQYFFASYRLLPGNKVVAEITVDIFRHQRGAWTKETFKVAPGDGIGANKNSVDYSTGATLVDLRPDTREKDLRILVADESGLVDTISFQAQKDDPWYKELLQKAAAAKPAGTASAGPVNPALINPIGAR